MFAQRVFGIALGYEDLNDHDDLRHGPLMLVLAGKLKARRWDYAPVAGKARAFYTPAIVRGQLLGTV
jgi:hypothetical protein